MRMYRGNQAYDDATKLLVRPTYRKPFLKPPLMMVKAVLLGLIGSSNINYNVCCINDGRVSCTDYF